MVVLTSLLKSCAHALQVRLATPSTQSTSPTDRTAGSSQAQCGRQQSNKQIENKRLRSARGLLAEQHLSDCKRANQACAPRCAGAPNSFAGPRPSAGSAAAPEPATVLTSKAVACVHMSAGGSDCHHCHRVRHALAATTCCGRSKMPHAGIDHMHATGTVQ